MKLTVVYRAELPWPASVHAPYGLFGRLDCLPEDDSESRAVYVFVNCQWPVPGGNRGTFRSDESQPRLAGLQHVATSSSRLGPAVVLWVNSDSQEMVSRVLDWAVDCLRRQLERPSRPSPVEVEIGPDEV